MSQRQVSIQDRPTLTSGVSGTLQRKCDACGARSSPGGDCRQCADDERWLRRRRIAEGISSELSGRPAEAPGRLPDESELVPSIVHDVLRSAGQPLDVAARAALEPRFGHDFSDVRVHTGARAGASARAVGASAYTVGRDIVFGSGRYAPGTESGRQLLAHELMHVVQQRGLREPSGDGLTLGDPSDAFEQEASRAAHRLFTSSGPTPSSSHHGPGARRVARPMIQRLPPGTLPPLLPPIQLPSESVEIGASESVSSTNPNLDRLARAFATTVTNHPRAYIRISGLMNAAAARTGSVAEAAERTRMRTRVNDVRDVLQTLGVPRSALQVEAPYAFSSTSGGWIDVRLFTEPAAPSTLLSLAPSLLPPSLLPSAPTTGSGTTALPSLSDMLTVKFKMGAAEFSLSIPKSLTVSLPVAIRDAWSLSFELKAEVPGSFSFSIAMNGIPHVRVIARAQLTEDPSQGTSGSVGLDIQLTRTVCSAENPQTLKSKIEAAGDKFKEAYTEYGTVQGSERTEKLIEMVSAMADMYDAVEKSSRACTQVPAVTFSIGVQGPIAPSSEWLNEPNAWDRPATVVGLSIAIPF